MNIDPEQIEEASREMLEPFARSEGESPYRIHEALQDAMQSYVGIFRVEEDLRKGLGELQVLKERASRLRVEGSRLFNPGWHLARDLKSMLTVSEAVALSALERRESRGAHSRIDYTSYDEGWSKQNNIVARDGTAMSLSQRPISEMPAELKQILDEGK